MENTWYALLLAVHNVVLIILSGGLLSLWLLTKDRPAHGTTALQSFDHLVEKNMLAHPQGYLRGLIMLGLTGGGLPLVHYLYHGTIKVQTAVSLTAFLVKMLLVAVLAVVLMLWAMRVDLPLGRAYGEAQAGKPEAPAKYFALAAARTGWMCWGWVLSIAVLVVTPFVTYFQK